MKYNYIIIEDNPVQRKILTTFLEKIPDIQLIGTFESAINAISTLQEQKIDFIFLDVQLPEIDGFTFIRTLDNPPKVIMISAHNHYAVEAFDIGITDFILKPITFERLVKAVNRAISTDKSRNVAFSQQDFFLKVGRESMKFQLEEIDYFEAYGSFTKVYVGGKATTLSESITEIEEKMSSEVFVRVHRSYLVAKSKIKGIASKHVTVNQIKIPLGPMYREKVEEILKK
jgi:DNA-binding LytR/AlgR family response regulator